MYHMAEHKNQIKKYINHMTLHMNNRQHNTTQHKSTQESEFREADLCDTSVYGGWARRFGRYCCCFSLTSEGGQGSVLYVPWLETNWFDFFFKILQLIWIFWSCSRDRSMRIYCIVLFIEDCVLIQSSRWGKLIYQSVWRNISYVFFHEEKISSNF